MSIFTALRQMFSRSAPAQSSESPSSAQLGIREAERRWHQLVDLLRSEVSRGGQDAGVLGADFFARRVTLLVSASQDARLAVTITDEQLSGDLAKFAGDLYGAYRRQLEAIGAETPMSVTPPASSDIESWLAQLMARMQPDQLRFEPGETLGDVVQRIAREEEAKIQRDPPELRAMKTQALSELRKQLG